MAQKFLTNATKQDLEDIRDIFLTHPEICVPHKENGCWYGDVATDDDDDEYMLCVITEAEQYLTGPQLAALLDNIPANFIVDDI